MRFNHIRILALIIVLILVINITLLALNAINELLFWAIIIAAAVFAYKFMKKR